MSSPETPILGGNGDKNGDRRANVYGVVYCDCINCSGRRAEAMSLAARVRMLDASLVDNDAYLIAHHARVLVGMMRERGMA